MLKLTKTGIGLLTRQYRSVLKKCWEINAGVWQITGDIASKVRNIMAHTLSLLDGLLNIKSDAFGAQAANATATELPFDAPTVAGTLSAFGANVTDGILLNLQSKKFVTLKALPVAVVAATVVATTILPSDAYAGDTGGSENTVNAYESSAFGYRNTASGQWSSAFGIDNKAYGIGSSAFGVASTAYGWGSSAFGFYVQAGDSSDATSTPKYATAVGSYVQATGLYALALGNQQGGMTQTRASGTSAIAIGTGAQAMHDNSVAIGTNSVSAGENTISVGNSTTQRQIKYVAAGTSDTDAVNLKQLNDAIAGVSGGGSSVTLDTTFDAESTNGATSQAIANYLDNNYYRKDKKSGILNGFEAGKIGNENDDNFSKFRADNDNFATVENKVA